MFNRHDDDRERRWERDRGEDRNWDRDRNENRGSNPDRDQRAIQDRNNEIWGQDRSREWDRNRDQGNREWDRSRTESSGRDSDRNREPGRDWNQNREGWSGSYGQPSTPYQQYDRGSSGTEGGAGDRTNYGRNSYSGQGGYGGHSSVHERQSSWRGPGYQQSGGWGSQGGHTSGWETAGTSDRNFSSNTQGVRDREDWRTPSRSSDNRQDTGMQSWGGTGSWGGGMTNYSQQGRYVGRGPKGWQRSDERIREDVNEQLTRHPDIDASEIEVEVNNCEVTLRGAIDDRTSKRLAEDVVENISGVREVHNHLKVKTGILNAIFGSKEENAKSSQNNQITNEPDRR